MRGIGGNVPLPSRLYYASGKKWISSQNIIFFVRNCGNFYPG
jgi:hypothetical protein